MALMLCVVCLAIIEINCVVCESVPTITDPWIPSSASSHKGRYKYSGSCMTYLIVHHLESVCWALEWLGVFQDTVSNWETYEEKAKALREALAATQTQLPSEEVLASDDIGQRLQEAKVSWQL